MGNCGCKRNKTPGAFDDDDKKLLKKVKEYNEKAMKYLVEKTLGTVPNDEYGFDRDGRKKDKKESKPKPFGRQTPTPPWISETGKEKLLF